MECSLLYVTVTMILPLHNLLCAYMSLLQFDFLLMRFLLYLSFLSSGLLRAQAKCLNVGI